VSADSFLNCFTNFAFGTDPNCRGHWYLQHMNWHWDTEINVPEHQGHKDSYQRAANRWEAQPNNPWEEHYNVDATTHINVVDVGSRLVDNTTLGAAEMTQENSQDHITYMAQLWARHDVGEVDCQPSQAGHQVCSWYTGTSTTVPAGQFDEWSVWMEELGHAQNMLHFVPSGHGSHRGDHTMSGTTVSASSAKRNTDAHEDEHACYAYELTHGLTCP
jgi:hypothetical protein